MTRNLFKLACAVGAALFGLAGCARFSVTQIDESPDERTITTRLTGTAFFSSAQTISKIKAVQTDKTQSFGTDALGQHGATNVAETVDALTWYAVAVVQIRPSTVTVDPASGAIPTGFLILNIITGHIKWQAGRYVWEVPGA